jgi:hypothetical protein
MSFLNCSSCFTREFVAIGRVVNSGESDGMDDDEVLVYLSRVTFGVGSNRTEGENGPIFGVL